MMMCTHLQRMSKCGAVFFSVLKSDRSDGINQRAMLSHVTLCFNNSKYSLIE
jgi:hypothetical protein